jgi:invasion protein IalB
MHSVAGYVLGVTAIACSFAATAAGEEAKVPALVYSPWAKFCIKDTCFTGSGARTECSVAVAAVVLARTDEAKKKLRVTLPRSVNVEHGVRISVDQSQPIELPFTQCYPNGCIADYEAGPELIDQLKHGRMLVVEAMDSANAPISRSLPLLHFSDAYDGPAHDPKAFIQVISKEEMQALEERGKYEAEERKARCGSNL